MQRGCKTASDGAQSESRANKQDGELVRGGCRSVLPPLLGGGPNCIERPHTAAAGRGGVIEVHT